MSGRSAGNVVCNKYRWRAPQIDNSTSMEQDYYNFINNYVEYARCRLKVGMDEYDPSQPPKEPSRKTGGRSLRSFGGRWRSDYGSVGVWERWTFHIWWWNRPTNRMGEVHARPDM